MSDKQNILMLRGYEFGITKRVLASYPEDRLDMRPAEKSRTARELISLFISEEYICRSLILGEPLHADRGPTRPDNLNGMIEMFQLIHSESQSILKDASDQQMKAIVDLYGMKMSVLEVLWAYLHDQIHHRGQFFVYLRLVGARVPSIYGPTADYPVELSDGYNKREGDDRTRDKPI